MCQKVSGRVEQRSSGEVSKQGRLTVASNPLRPLAGFDRQAQ
ncbi:hypothetical protein MMMB2_2065 [Mycobacterium marinum MB2]|nr:hypothetical protein MMMB2_2065 [Mycobacterium marinum MB2]